MEKTPDWYCNYKVPEAWSGSFQPVVGVTGLDHKDNLHPSVWDNLSTNNDFTPKYIMNQNPSQLPPKKTRRNDIELASYVPSGLMRNNWAEKHRSLIPAVMVAFFHENTPQAKEETPKTLAQLRENCKIHGTQLLVMLIKGPEDEELSTERASALYNAADIPPKSLFILTNSHPDRIFTSMQRLQNGMKEAAKAYYAARIRRIKNNREKTTNPFLIVRYHMKLGFFQEVRRDYISAMSHYESALEGLESMMGLTEKSEELRIVGGIVCYRVLRLHLLRLDCKSATTHFRKHINVFSKLPQTPQHLAYLQQLYHSMGELLKLSYRRGHISSANPASYFITAAKFGQERARLVKLNSESTNTQTNFDNFQALYLGQLPTYLTLPILQYLEQISPHSEQIINHLGVGSDFCKEIGHLRTRCQLMYLMGEEFFRSGEFGRSSLLMSHVLRELGSEKWSHILYQIAQLGLRSAIVTADIPAFFNFLVVLLKTDLRGFVGEARSEYSQILNELIARRIPPVELFQQNRNQWEKALSHDKSSGVNDIISYVAVHKESILEAEFWVEDESAFVNTSSNVHCRLKNRHDASIYVDNVAVQISGAIEEARCSIRHTLEPNELLERTFPIVPLPPDANKLIQLQMGIVDIGRHSLHVLLHYPLLLVAPLGLKVTNETRRTVLKVEPRKIAMSCDVTSANPVLIGETAKILVQWTNSDYQPVTNLTLHFHISSAFATPIPPQKVRLGIRKSDMESSSCTGSGTQSVDVGILNGNSSHQITLYMRCEVETELNLVCVAKFGENGIHQWNKDYCHLLKVSQPMQIQHHIKSVTTGEPLNSAALTPSTPFLLICSFTNIAHASLNIRSMKFNFNEDENFSIIGGNLDTIGGTMLKSADQIQTLAMIHMKNLTSKNQLGELVVTWNRDGEDDSVEVSSIYEVDLEWSNGFLLVGEYERAFLKQPFRATYLLVNHTPFSHNLSISIDSTEYFMNAGPKKVNVKLKREDSVELSYVLFPLKTGMVTAPKVIIENVDQQQLHIYRDLPKTIFVTRGEEIPASS